MLFTQNRALGVGEFLATALVAALFNELLGSGKVVLRRLPGVVLLTEKEAGAVEVDVGKVQPHRTALGNVPRFVQVSPRAFGVTPKNS